MKASDWLVSGATKGESAICVARGAWRGLGPARSANASGGGGGGCGGVTTHSVIIRIMIRCCSWVGIRAQSSARTAEIRAQFSARTTKNRAQFRA